MLSEETIKRIIDSGTPAVLYAGKRVLVLTPDGTRTCPLPMMVRIIRDMIGEKAACLDFMVALGTHPILPEDKILELYGISPACRKDLFGRSAFFCHRWDLPDTFRRIGQFSAEEIERISGGLLKESVPVDINKKIYDYDLVLILGPVFPHEVVGFSGGAKYLFPGISGGDFLHFFHWLGALLTCRGIIGIKKTPVRDLIDRALSLIDVSTHHIAMVVDAEAKLRAVYAGPVKTVWSEAADLSSQIHIVTKQTPYRIVLGRAAEMYDELWTAGKVMYKLEQVVAPGGKLIIYAPHIRFISRTWGTEIERIGYHIRDYFLARMADFSDVPRGVLAHSTHVRGSGVCENGIEKPRIDVILATGIPKAVCRKVNLGYMNPAEIRISDYQGREGEGILFVDHAGEIVYRLADG